MKKITEYIGSQFGNPHGFVGAVCCLCMNVINQKMYNKIVSLMDAKDGEAILDIGYGNGFLLREINKNFKVKMHGIDISEDMKAIATKRNRRAMQDGRLELQVGNCCELPYEDNMFSTVTSVNTIYFWEDTVKGLSEIKRVLKPGASFLNVVYTKEWLDKMSITKKGFKKYGSEDLVSLGKQAGFENIQVKDIVKGKSFVVIYT
ncbi:MAG: class I SAM-dependent methyltransferase [Eubacteriales bacterium]|nr:class I SAM-dependent methyltransferase [Lachnospiraceae bacterium]MDO5126648.1 class I SAM-dependent methyltransferase [Eubacteriales bacterium]